MNTNLSFKIALFAFITQFILPLTSFGGGQQEIDSNLFKALLAKNPESIKTFLGHGASLAANIDEMKCCIRSRCKNDNRNFHYLVNHIGIEITDEIFDAEILKKQNNLILGDILRWAIRENDLVRLKKFVNLGIKPHLFLDGSGFFNDARITHEEYASKGDIQRQIIEYLKTAIVDLPFFYGMKLSPELLQLSRPSNSGYPILDNHLDSVEFYLGIMKEHTTQFRLGPESIAALNIKLDEAVSLFGPVIENGGNFSFVEGFWRKLQAEVSDIKNSSLINIAVIHFLSFKLCLLADLSRFNSPESINIFMELKESRIKHLVARYIKDPENYTIEKVLNTHSIQDFHKIKYYILAVTIPLIDNDPLFGINTFFYAFLNQSSILGYTPQGSATAHGGYLESFFMDHLWSSYDVSGNRSALAQETSPSSCLFLWHDAMHISIYEGAFNDPDSVRRYAKCFDELSNSITEKDLLNQVFLFIIAHELGLSLDNFPSGYRRITVDHNKLSRTVFLTDKKISCKIEFILLTYFPAYEDIRAINEEHKKHVGTFYFWDIAHLLKQCGAEINLESKVPWTLGPQIAEILINQLYNTCFGRGLKKILGE